MLQLTNVAKSFGSQVLFSEVNFSIGDGERVGFVGKNGHGKSTLFRMILKEEETDEGEIILSKNSRLGYLQQHIKMTKTTVLEEACLGLPEHEKDATYKVEKILMGLGFSTSDFKKSPLELSGGYQVRLNLAKVLVSDAHLLLLDEPTNYLDILSLRWLSSFLKSWPHEVFLITHDREFMDSVITHVVGIHRRKMRKMKGKTQDYFDQIIEEEEIYEKTRLNEEKKVKEIENFINKFRAKARQGSLVQSRIKTLAKKQSMDKLESLEQLDFEFSYAPFTGKLPVQVKDLTFGYDKTLAPLIENLNISLNSGDCLAIIGKNGKGKTTLLNLIAGNININPDSGSIVLHQNAQVAYFGQTNKQHLNSGMSVEEEIKDSNPDLPYTRIRQICGAMMFEGDMAKKKIAVLSGGEKSRVMLGKILAHPSNFLLLDEPTNHLDMESCESLCQGIIKFPGTVILVTHNEGLLKILPNKFLVFQKKKIEFFEGSYEEFLEKIGWEEENESSSSQNEFTEEVIDYNLLKIKRRELISLRSKDIGPLKIKLDQIETKILNFEEEKEKITNKVIELSSSATTKSEDLQQHSKRIGEIEKELSSLYDQFEIVGEEYETKKLDYDQKLKDLDSKNS